MWRQQVCLGSNPRLLLVLDVFIAHRTDLVKCRLSERNADMAVIPSGLTS
ncbi:17866_t:CDS:1, partial [Dentiscutata erythropus]